MTQRVENVAVWSGLARAGLVRDLLARGGLSVTAAGSPVAGEAKKVAAVFEAGTAEDDARRLIVDPPAGTHAVLLADLAEAPALDARAFAQASAKGIRVLSLVPVPGSALAYTGDAWAETPGTLAHRRLLGLLRIAAPFREADEILTRFAPGSGTDRGARAAWVESVCGTHEGTLGTRLWDSIDTLRLLLGEAETVSAVYAAPPGPGAASATPGETLLGLSGTLAVTLRFAGGVAGSVLASDQSSSWRRSASVVGPEGRLTLSDAGFAWRDAGGGLVDSGGDVNASVTATDAIGADLARALDPAAASDPPGDPVAVLAMTQAALLSARTGQPESPATIRRMMGLPEK
jgi:hypothetical protein